MQKLLMITGGNKGIGKGIVDAYKNKGYQIISIARNKNTEADFADIKQVQFDLADVANISNMMETIFKSINPENVQGITLINNAGTLGQITTIDKKTASDIAQNIQLNITAPLILTSSFLSLTNNWSCRKRVLTISSGAGKNPYYGWATYCASKAAVDMMTRAVAIEQNSLKYGAKIIAISPGVVDTEMQNHIRNSNKTDFIDLDKFIGYKQNGALADAGRVGKEIYTIDHNDMHENGAIAHVNELR